MSRYIDADEIIYTHGCFPECNGNCMTCESNVVYKDVIDEIPTADVQEVKHGKWILKHIGAGHYWGCSICSSSLICLSEGMNYCPYCGAKMDLED